MRVVKTRNNRKQEVFKGSLNSCKSCLRGIIEQLSDGNLNPLISLEYTDTKVVYTYDDKIVIWDIIK